MNNTDDAALLQSIRDIQVPDGVAWWPPALGWWLLAATLTALAAALAIYQQRRSRLRRVATAELSAITERFEQHQDRGRLAMEISILLRRIALVRYPTESVAALSGMEWLGFLEERGAGFLGSEAKCNLAQAPYAKNPEYDSEWLLDLAGRWIRNNT